MEKDLQFLSSWTDDLARLGPKFGLDIMTYPFSIHRLIPPFCPTKSQIGLQFGRFGDVAIKGTGGLPGVKEHWDECIAEVQVTTNDGRIDRSTGLVCTDTLFAVGLGDPEGTVVLFDAETCQEYQRFQHGEFLGAMNMDETGSQVVTGGSRYIKTWDTNTGELIRQWEHLYGTQGNGFTYTRGGIVFYNRDPSCAGGTSEESSRSTHSARRPFLTALPIRFGVCGCRPRIERS